nr:UBN2 domain-containing protein [Tanacetum cinerariifolium]
MEDNDSDDGKVLNELEEYGNAGQLCCKRAINSFNGDDLAFQDSIDSGFSKFNTIITSLKALDEGFSSKNYVRKFLRALHLKWRENVTTIEELKDLSSLALDERIGNLEVHEVVMEKDYVIYRGKEEKIKSISLKAKKVFSDDETVTSKSDDKEYAMAICLRTCLEPDEWIKDSGYSKHMIGNKSLFSTYKAYDRVTTDSPAEEAETKSNVWDDGSDNVNPFGGENPRFHDNPLLTKETKLEPIIWDIGDEEKEYPSFQEEPIVLVEEELCPVYDANNKEEESLPVYDTDIEDVI